MLNPAFLMDLVRARVILADDGMVGATGGMGPTADIAQLPGGGIVRVFMLAGDIHVGIAHPTGDAAVPPRRISHPIDFAATLSCIDVMMADGLAPGAGLASRLADDLVWTIRHHALPARLPQVLEIGQQEQDWSPSDLARGLLRDVISQAPTISPLVGSYLAGDAAPPTPPTYWLDRLDAWLRQDSGLVDVVIPGDGMRWRRVRTTPGLAAAMARCRRRPHSPDFHQLQSDAEVRVRNPMPMLGDRTMIYELDREGADGVLVAGLTAKHELVAAGHVGSDWALEAMDLLQSSLGVPRRQRQG